MFRFIRIRQNLPAEVGGDIELKVVQLQFPSTRTLDKNPSLYKVTKKEVTFT